MNFFLQLAIGFIATAVITAPFEYMLRWAFALLIVICLIFVFCHYRTRTGQDLRTCEKCGEIYEYDGDDICEDCITKLVKSLTDGV